MENSEKSFWSKMNDIHVGPIPLPVFIVFSAIIIWAMYTMSIPVDVMGGMAVILMLGWALGKIGSSIPVFNKFGGATILAMIVPAVFVLFRWLPQNSIDAVEMLMREANFLDLYVFSLVAGSILGMNRNVLVQGFARMVLPMMTGFVLALVIPSAIGWALGLGFQYSLFYIVTPSLAGGIGGGVLPLSAGYAAITGVETGSLIAILAPASILANFFSIAGAALMSRLGDQRPQLTGNGTLVKTGKIDLDEEDATKKDSIFSIDLLGKGFFLLVVLFVSGNLLEAYITIPAAVIIIFGSTVLKYFKVLPSSLEEGAKQLYSLISKLFTDPLMVGLGIIYLTLEDVLAILSWQYLLVIASVVLTLALVGYFMSGLVNMYPVEASILSMNQSAMGGTGNVAILATADRQEMMPFAQVATRIGGAITITLMITLMRFI